MLYTGIIAALSSLDLGIKWLIDREKPENFPKPLPHTKGKILLYRNHNAGFPFGFLEQHAELVRMLPLAVISGLAGFLAAILPQKGKTVQKFGIAVILGGAVSNLYDRMVRHYVVDYFSIQCLQSWGYLCISWLRHPVRSGVHKGNPGYAAGKNSC